MNEVQRQVTAKVDAACRPAMELYENRNRLFYLVNQLDLDMLKEVRRVLSLLGPDELRDLLAYAEGLAAWRMPEQESPDAPISQGSSTAPGPAGAR